MGFYIAGGVLFCWIDGKDWQQIVSEAFLVSCGWFACWLLTVKPDGYFRGKIKRFIEVKSVDNKE